MNFVRSDVDRTFVGNVESRVVMRKDRNININKELDQGQSARSDFQEIVNC